MIPKNIYFYWGNEKMSFLRYMTFYSFCKYNPDWNVTLIKRKNNSIKKDFGWSEKQDFNNFTGTDYIQYIDELEINIEYLEDEYPEIAKATNSDVHISDLLGWYILGTKGGVIADTDILFFNKLLYDGFKEFDVGLITFKGNPLKNYIPVSFMIGSGNEFFKRIYDHAIKNFDEKIYESAGTQVIKAVYNDIDNFQKEFPDLKFINVPGLLIFPFSESHYKYNDFFELMYKINAHHLINEHCLGIHWYAGNPISQQYNNKVTEVNYNRIDNTMSKLIGKVLNDDIKNIKEL